jgi:hypothetical protein
MRGLANGFVPTDPFDAGADPSLFIPRIVRGIDPLAGLPTTELPNLLGSSYIMFGWGWGWVFLIVAMSLVTAVAYWTSDIFVRIAAVHTGLYSFFLAGTIPDAVQRLAEALVIYGMVMLLYGYWTRRAGSSPPQAPSWSSGSAPERA